MCLPDSLISVPLRACWRALGELAGNSWHRTFFLSTVFYILFLGINGEPVSAVEHWASYKSNSQSGVGSSMRPFAKSKWWRIVIQYTGNGFFKFTVIFGICFLSPGFVTLTNILVRVQIKLDALLGAPDALQLAQWKLLISGSHRKIIQRRALDTVLSIYEQLYEAVHNPANCYENPSSIMPRTPQQVRNLLVWSLSEGHFLLNLHIFCLRKDFLNHLICQNLLCSGPTR